MSLENSQPFTIPHSWSPQAYLLAEAQCSRLVKILALLEARSEVGGLERYLQASMRIQK